VSVSVMVLVLQVTPVNPQGGSMYETPKLVRFGSFRDLTLQTPSDCTNGGTVPKPWTFKTAPFTDSFVPGGTDDGCPAVARS
jgi:hypothetical protein